MMLETTLKTRRPKDRPKVKAREISKIRSVRKTNCKKMKIRIEAIKDIDGGVECLVKAWKRGNKKIPIAFGKYGDIETERIRVYNPPVLVEDKNGVIVRTDEDVDGNLRTFKFKEDPKEALLRSLEHTIGVIGKDSSRMISGKVGNTTTTQYPNGGNGTSPSDNSMKRDDSNVTFTTIRNRTIASSMRNSTTDISLIRAHTTTDRFQRIDRGAFGFPTGDLPDGDEISSATISLYGVDIPTGLGDTDLSVVAFTPASGATFVTDDYDQFGTTQFSAGAALSTLSTGAYNDFSLNASGIASISKTADTFFGMRLQWDIDDNFTGTWSSNALSYMEWRSADQTGTTEDPKIVIEHAEPVSFIPGGGIDMFDALSY